MEIGARRRHQGAEPRRRACRQRSVPGVVRQRCCDAGDGQDDGQSAHYLRHGQSRSGDFAGRGSRRQARRDRGDGAFRLSQPGEQRVGLSLYLPRRARCARTHHQRRDEDRGGGSVGRTRARRRARRSGDGLWRQADLRPRLHHSRTVRSAARSAASLPPSRKRPSGQAWRAASSRTPPPIAMR